MLIERDFFTDPEILLDPYSYFEEVRRLGPIAQVPGKDYLIVTGFAEALAIFLNTTDFSASIALQGAACPLSFTPEGPDISDQLEAHRTEIIGHDLLVNLDDRAHANLRALVNRLFTPSRLKANETFIRRYSAELVDQALGRGSCELIGEIATPFVTMVIADLLGVPADDRQFFMDIIQSAPPPGSLDSAENDFASQADHPMPVMARYFAGSLPARLSSPRQDILSEHGHAA